MASRPDWAGRTVVCIASGPSLTQEDCEAVFHARELMPVIVTNNTYLRTLWADVLFGFDYLWWNVNVEAVRASGFVGRLVCVSQLATKLGVETMYGATWARPFGNSGAGAIGFAIGAGAARVILLGYDCALGPNGRRHWHGDHPSALRNCTSIEKWPEQFRRVAVQARKAGVEVLNASRSTALQCFERVTLESVL